MSRPAIYLYAFGTAAAGVLDFIWGDLDSSHQPIQAFGDHIPGIRIIAYITAVWMIAGSAAILWRRSARASAVAVAGIYSVIAVFWLPRFYTAPKAIGFHASVEIGVLGGFGGQLIAVAAGALVYASLATESPAWPLTILISRWVFGISSISFGLGHLFYLQQDTIYVPKWLPLGAEFWTIFTGICFILAGLAILSGIQEVLAARLLALMLFVFNLIALPPFIFAHPERHAAWGGSAYNLAAVASAWILADALVSRRARQHKAGAALAVS